MITKVEIVDFMSHKETTLNFDAGMNVITGPNGSGKSSVVDAVTFALFGKHMRSVNPSLTRHGASSGYTKVEFTSGARSFRVTRKINNNGSTHVSLYQKIDGEWNNISAGERKQMGESTSNKIEKIFDMNFDKLQIVSIIQQGELASIVHDIPSVFKTRINEIIGINALDKASQHMNDLQRMFQDHIRKDLGHDDSYLPTLMSKLTESARQLEKTRQDADALESKTTDLEHKVGELDAKIEEMVDAERSQEVWYLRMGELVKYVQSLRKQSKDELTKLHDAIVKCESALEARSIGEGATKELEAAQQDEEFATSGVNSCNLSLASLNEQLELSSKLVITDGRCPVCDSEVSHLKPMYVREHIDKEIAQIHKNAAKYKTAQSEAAKKISDLQLVVKRASAADATLRAHLVNSTKDVDAMKKKVARLEETCKKADACIDGDWKAAQTIDVQARAHCDVLTSLDSKRIPDIDASQIDEMRGKHDDMRRKLDETRSQHGATQMKVEILEEEILRGKDLQAKLEIVQAYTQRLERIRSVFSRDGVVATGMRSYILNEISEACTEHLAVLGTRINRITLSEQSSKKRSVMMTCHDGNDKFEIASLSGGEQICVALALRLGIASMLSSPGPSFVILDEPTAHLDAEHRKSLARALTGFARSAESGSPMQFIIITHDMGIFDEAAIENHYKFERSSGVTRFTQS